MTGSCPSEAVLAMLCGGELPTEQATLVRQHCADCADCHSVVQALERSSLIRDVPWSLVRLPQAAGVTADMVKTEHAAPANAAPANVAPGPAMRRSSPEGSVTALDEEPWTGAHSLVGRVLKSDYRIEEYLGGGMMGDVYLASHLRLPKRVAIKTLRVVTNPELFSRFRREAEITSRLRHSNIVAVSDYAQLDDGTAFLVMDYLPGETLAQRLDRVGRLTVLETLTLARALGSGLAAAHAEHVVHRDLKPANVILAQQVREGKQVETPVLVDFGISKIRDGAVSLTSSGQLTNSGQLIGTPCYMSPEQASGDNDAVDERTDQWALGVIMYECLCGERAFQGKTVGVVLDQVRRHQPPSLRRRVPGVPKRVDVAILRALSKRREERFSSITAFLHALEHAPQTAIRLAALPGVGLSSAAGVLLLGGLWLVQHCVGVGHGPAAISTAPVIALPQAPLAAAAPALPLAPAEVLGGAPAPIPAGPPAELAPVPATPAQPRPRVHRRANPTIVVPVTPAPHASPPPPPKQEEDMPILRVTPKH